MVIVLILYFSTIDNLFTLSKSSHLLLQNMLVRLVLWKNLCE